ncbi:MAG: hypothetical protein WBN40_03775 [Pseudomonadales bacterium]
MLRLLAHGTVARISLVQKHTAMLPAKMRAAVLVLLTGFFTASIVLKLTAMGKHNSLRIFACVRCKLGWPPTGDKLDCTTG